MRKLTESEIRKLYQDFFEKKKSHLKLASASLIPYNDDSLLLINSGMAQFKTYFSGQEIPPSKRITTCQKCVRTNDIENVGKTSRHATFFEMLGNFSFGDYFKLEAIKWAWEFVTQVLGLPEDKLSVTIYKDDDEAFDIWHNNIGLSEQKIFRMDKDDNFWEIGVGPCGPCSEIYFDRGEKYGCKNKNKNCKPGCDCDRFVEIWNLVFTQFNHNLDGSYSKLKQKNIDTGMGLERISAIIQNVDSIYDIDSIKSTRDKVCELSNKTYNHDKKNDISIRIITDHIRAITFMLCDGIFPANDGRGYVLKRLIRRAICHGKLLGINKNFLSILSDIVIKNFSDAYPELEQKKSHINKIILEEEQKFSDTLLSGLNILTEIIENLKSDNKKTISGEIIFKLHDTFGFPIDMAKEIAEQNNLEINQEELDKKLKEQKQNAQENSKNNLKEFYLDSMTQEKIRNLPDTEFVGYNNLKINNAKVLAIILDSKITNEISSDQKGLIIFDKTPFFAESSGQISDSGFVKAENISADIYDCQKIFGNKFVHKIKIINGNLKINQIVNLEIDSKKRLNISRNHTATHLLHKTLRENIDPNIKQMGSYVDDKRLRFDFLCARPLDKNQIKLIENIVNQKILESLDISISQKNISDALNTGATALFGEKYGSIVRVVNMSDYSIELCSGTHLKNTSQVGVFKIIYESSISSGVRRIEAVTGYAALDYVNQIENQIEDLCLILKTNKNNILDKTTKLLLENKNLREQLQKNRLELAKNIARESIKDVKNINNKYILIKITDNLEIDFLRIISDEIRNKFNNKCSIFLLNKISDIKLNITASTNDSNIDVGQIIKNTAKIFNAKGGGNKRSGQAGGFNISDIDKIIDKIQKQI